MRILTTTICLTIVVLLGSMGVSWGAGGLCAKDSNGNYNPRHAFMCKKMEKRPVVQKKPKSEETRKLTAKEKYTKRRELNKKKRKEARLQKRCSQKRHMKKQSCKIFLSNKESPTSTMVANVLEKATTLKSLHQFCKGGGDFNTLGCKGYSTSMLARRLRGENEKRNRYYKMVRDEFKPLAESGHPVFAYLLGGLFEMDPRLGGMGDHKGALRWYKLVFRLI